LENNENSIPNTQNNQLEQSWHRIWEALALSVWSGERQLLARCLDDTTTPNNNTNLTKDNGHTEIVDEKALWVGGIIVAEKKHCENNDNKLMRRICEGTPEHFDTTDDDYYWWNAAT